MHNPSLLFLSLPFFNLPFLSLPFFSLPFFSSSPTANYNVIVFAPGTSWRCCRSCSPEVQYSNIPGIDEILQATARVRMEIMEDYHTNGRGRKRKEKVHVYQQYNNSSTRQIYISPWGMMSLHLHQLATPIYSS